MIADLFVALELLLSPADRAANEIGAGLEECRGNADVCETELIGTVIIAPIGKLIGFYHSPLAGGNAFDHRVER